MNTYWVIFIVAEIAWLWCLALHLQDEKINSTDKICWTIVLCLLNVIGLIMFILFGPKTKTEFKSEADLKRAFNEGLR
jgi:hypothetical protein